MSQNEHTVFLTVYEDGAFQFRSIKLGVDIPISKLASIYRIEHKHNFLENPVAEGDLGLIPVDFTTSCKSVYFRKDLSDQALKALASHILWYYYHSPQELKDLAKNRRNDKVVYMLGLGRFWIIDRRQEVDLAEFAKNNQIEPLPPVDPMLRIYIHNDKDNSKVALPAVLPTEVKHNLLCNLAYAYKNELDSVEV